MINKLNSFAIRLKFAMIQVLYMYRPELLHQSVQVYGPIRMSSFQCTG